MTKITAFSSLTGAGVDAANDVLPIVDVSAGAAGNKKITIDELGVAMQTIIDARVAAGAVGLLDFKGSTDCSSNPNYPAASKGDTYRVSVAGKIGGASGIDVEAADVYYALADNAGGTQASVGTSWDVIQGNTTGSTVASLDDVGDVNAPTPANGDVLTWDSTPGEWVSAAPTGGSNALDDLTDVNAPTPSDGDVLTFNNGTGDWEAAAPSGGSVSAWKAPVRVATTVAGTLASSFENGDTVDGVVLATNDRILIKDQATASENGIYTVNASGAPTRATDADAGSELVGAIAFVSEGTINADTIWKCTNNATPTLGSTSLVFNRVGSDWKTVSSTSPSGASSVDVANLGGYSEVLVIARALTASVSGVRRVLVSTDNGSTFDTTVANYQAVGTGGVEANAATAGIAYHTTASTSARTLVAHINNLKGAVKWCTFKGSDTDIIYVGSASDINAVRVDNNNGGTISGGPIYVLAR